MRGCRRLLVAHTVNDMSQARTRVVVGVHSVEVREAVFLALAGDDAVQLVGMSVTAAELATSCRALRPDIVVVQEGLSGRTVPELAAAADLPITRVLVIPRPDNPASPPGDVTRDLRDLASLIANRVA